MLSPYVPAAGTWGLGVATQRCGVNAVPLGQDSESWVLRHDGGLAHDGEVKSTLPQVPEEGDIIVSTKYFMMAVKCTLPHVAEEGDIIIST